MKFLVDLASRFSSCITLFLGQFASKVAIVILLLNGLDGSCLSIDVLMSNKVLVSIQPHCLVNITLFD